jgi:hypothetical protein
MKRIERIKADFYLIYPLPSARSASSAFYPVIQPVGLSLFVSIGEMLYYMRDLCDALGCVVSPYQENFFFHLISDDSTRKGDCTCRQNRVLSAL